MRSEFVAYVGPVELHDARVLRFAHLEETAKVLVQACDGRQLILSFEGVGLVVAELPEGMVLYALSEWTAPAPLRRFVFANWDEEDPKRLELLARGFRVVYSESPTSHGDEPTPAE